MKYQDTTTSKSGIKVGDFILATKSSAMYGRVIKIRRRFATAGDWCVKYQYGKNRVKVGDEISSILTVKKILGLNMIKPKRKSQASVEDDKAIVIDKVFVSLLFKELNDTIVYVKMVSEQEGLI